MPKNHQLMLQIIDRRGISHPVTPLSMRQIIKIGHCLAVGEKYGENVTVKNILAELKPNIPPEIITEISDGTIAALTPLLLFMAGKKATGGNRVSPLFAAAIIMKHFSAYKLDQLLELTAPEFDELYRLAAAIRFDECIHFGLGMATALRNDFRNLLQQRQAWMPVMPQPETNGEITPEQLNRARELAAELYQNQAAVSNPLCRTKDLTQE